jgi:beta-lactamase regulating signal transducer with metallopeptidase domain
VIQQQSSTTPTETLPTNNAVGDNTTNITSEKEEIQIYTNDTPKQKIEPITVVSLIWILGVLILWGYHIQSYLRMKKYLRGATEVESDIYEWSGNQLSFVYGIISPKIYLSRNTPPNSRNVIICHEQVHLKRRDYIVKAACLMISCVHWFNPLVWLSFFLMNNDMEIACDEEVVRLMGEESKSTYSQALLNVAKSGVFRNTRLSFGENSVKNRIKHILSYKKAPIWILVIGVAVIALICVGVLSNPKTNAVIDNGLFEDEALNSILSQKEYDADVESIFYTKDYDNDGKIESFVVIGNEDDFGGDDMLSGDLWFVSSELNADNLQSDEYIYKEQSYFEANDGKSYLVFSYIDGNPVLGNVYGVSNSKAVDMIPYGESKRIENGEIIVTASSYDADYSKEDSLLTGHTWKDYSFYYQNGQFLPYKGEVVTSEYVGSYKNGSEIISELNSDTTIAKLQYIKRENGYLQINIARDYGDYLSFSHRTYKINTQNQLELTEEEEGCYKVNIDDENEIEFPYEIIEEYSKEENG